MSSKVEIKKVANLLSKGSSNQKTAKNEHETFILYLSASYNNDFNIDLCPDASEGCRKACLVTAGLAGVYKSINLSRRNKANYFLADRQGFLTQLVKELTRINNRAIKQKKYIAIRLNGTSDLNFYAILRNFGHSFETFKNLRFYDYTKSLKRALHHADSQNYTVTYSYNEDTTDEMLKTVIANNITMAAVFNKLPETFENKQVVDGDLSDDLMLSIAKGSIIGLKAKGEAKKDKSGFVIQIS